MFGKKYKDLDQKIFAIQNNISNNYYDAARDAYKEARAMYEASNMSDKNRNKYDKIFDEIDRKFSENKITHKTHVGW